MRQPTLPAESVQVWVPVAHWVEQLSKVLAAHSKSLYHQPYAVQLGLFTRWYQSLGIQTPDCFNVEHSEWGLSEESKRWSITRASSGNLNNSTAKKSPEITGAYSTRADVLIYRAMARHLRRHGHPNPDRWIGVLMRSFNPVTFATLMSRQPKAQLAFTEMLWSRNLEPSVEYRRWPNRMTPVRYAVDRPPVNGHQIQLSLDLSELVSDYSALSMDAYRWVMSQAYSTVLLSIWAAAVQQTQDSIRKGWANWSAYRHEDQVKEQYDKVVWFCSMRGTYLDFTGYSNHEAVPPSNFGACIRQRFNRAANAAQQRLSSFRQTAGQPCLAWDVRDGWRMESGAIPDAQPINEISLLHTGLPTKAWVYHHGGQMIARLGDGKLQCAGASAREAICNLRQATLQYRKLYGQGEAAKGTNEKKEIVLSPEHQHLVNLVIVQLLSPKGSGGRCFWFSSGALSTVDWIPNRVRQSYFETTGRACPTDIHSWKIPGLDGRIRDLSWPPLR